MMNFKMMNIDYYYENNMMIQEKLKYICASSICVSSICKNHENEMMAQEKLKYICALSICKNHEDNIITNEIKYREYEFELGDMFYDLRWMIRIFNRKLHVINYFNKNENEMIYCNFCDFLGYSYFKKQIKLNEYHCFDLYYKVLLKEHMCPIDNYIYNDEFYIEDCCLTHEKFFKNYKIDMKKKNKFYRMERERKKMIEEFEKGIVMITLKERTCQDVANFIYSFL